MKKFWFYIILAVFAIDAYSIEVNPSRRVVPESFTNPQGKRFSIFAGDPERVQKANEVKIEDFEAQVVLPRKTCSLAQIKKDKVKHPALEVNFIVKNKSPRSYTLSFPDAQRYDIMIKNPKGDAIYVWSEDKAFVKEIGKSFVNKNERLIFKPNPEIDLAEILPYLHPGTYKISAVLSNYPEIKAETDWTIIP